jgi:pyrroline-5-carboxylate reductase
MTIGFIGAGNMGTALCKAFLTHDSVSAEDIIVSDHSEDKLSVISASLGVRTSKDISELMDVDYLILAVKPQGLDSLAEEIKEKINVDTILISVLAGTSIETLQNKLSHLKIVRAMPNTPALVNKGVIGWYAINEISPDKKSIIKELFASAGLETELEKEALIDDLTVISGCGPGFLFAIFDAWSKGTHNLDLNEETRKLLLIETLEGSLELLRQSEEEPAELAARVASKGGATEKGLEVLQNANIEATFSDMIQAAYDRCKELG